MTLDIRMTVDLEAIAANWRLLNERVKTTQCAAVVKADGYGLGLSQVAPALRAAGCTCFFVACLTEGLELRAILPQADIYILNGIPEGDERQAFEARLIPMVNSLAGLARLKQASPDNPAVLGLNIDTGMNRLGFDHAELTRLRDHPELLSNVHLALVMSHLITPEHQAHPLNKRQRERFCKALEFIPSARSSLAASSGIFLDKTFLFDVVRPGAALFGINPLRGQPNPMQPVVTLEARILQIHDVQPGETVGYGGDWVVEKPSRIAIIGIGYADGLPRCLGNRGYGYVGGMKVPFAGRVSMDLLALDITAVHSGRVKVGDYVEFIGPNRPLDDVAQEAETIGYEILTGLGRRSQRIYLGSPQEEEV